MTQNITLKDVVKRLYKPKDYNKPAFAEAAAQDLMRQGLPPLIGKVEDLKFYWVSKTGVVYREPYSWEPASGLTEKTIVNGLELELVKVGEEDPDAVRQNPKIIRNYVETEMHKVTPYIVVTEEDGIIDTDYMHGV